MKKNNNCCLYAVIAGAIAVIGIGFLHSYGIGEWNLLSWVGALVVIGAVLVCAKCKRGNGSEE